MQEQRNTRTLHHLKTVQPYYDSSAAGEKTFEIRNDDRDYKVGDILHLYEWDGEKPTGREHWKEVTYLLKDKPFVPDGYVCLGVKPVIPLVSSKPENPDHSQAWREFFVNRFMEVK
jgi:hypothetical protein